MNKVVAMRVLCIASHYKLNKEKNKNKNFLNY
jgi:hypothetical protein